MVKSTFSIEPGCFKKEEENEFLKAGEDVFKPTFWIGLKFLSMPLLPKWAFDLIPVS